MKKVRNNILFVALLLSCLFITGCKKGIPREVIQPVQMENLLVDYHIAKAMGDELPFDERYKQTIYLDYVMKKHNTSQAVFDSSMVWYTRHTNELSKIYEKVNARLKADQRNLDDLIAVLENKPKMSPEGDSVDVWYDKRIYQLERYILANKLTFTLPADSNYKERDSLVWKMNYRFMPSDSLQNDSAYMAFSITYENDSIISAEKKITHSGMDSLLLMSDSAYKLKELKGFVYYFGNDSNKILLLDNISLMRYHRPLVNDSIAVEQTDSLVVE